MRRKKNTHWHWMQHRFIEWNTLKRFDPMNDCNPISTLVDSSNRLSKTICPQTAKHHAMMKHKQTISSTCLDPFCTLQHRPGLTFSSQQLASPVILRTTRIRNTGELAKRILRHLAETKTLGLTFRHMKEKQTPTLSRLRRFRSHSRHWWTKICQQAVFSPSMELLSFGVKHYQWKKKKQLPYRAQKVNLSPHRRIATQKCPDSWQASYELSRLTTKLSPNLQYNKSAIHMDPTLESRKTYLTSPCWD